MFPTVGRIVHSLRRGRGRVARDEQTDPVSCSDCDHLMASHYTGTEVKTGCAYPGCSCQRNAAARW
jgi:hypothetical protein